MKKIILIFILFLLDQNFQHANSFIDKIEINKTDIYYNNLHLLISDIKTREEFVDSIYISPNGQQTIGYGHVILNSDILPSKITHEQADSILKSDLEKTKTEILRFDSLTDFKLLAVVSFSFNHGVYYYKKSTLRKLINNNLSIDSTIIKYTKYKCKNDSTYKTSNVLLKSRLFELNLYNSK